MKRKIKKEETLMLENLLLALPRAEIYEAGICIAKTCSGFFFLILLILTGLVILLGPKRV